MTHLTKENEVKQLSLLSILGLDLNADQKKIKRRKYKRKHVSPAEIEARKAEIQAQMEMFLDILDTPDAILDVPEDWTDSEIISLREFMLKRHVKLILDGRSKSVSSQEAWEWILSEDTHPFSFRVCIESLSKQIGLAFDSKVYVDRDEVRSGIYYLVTKQKGPQSFSLII
jgi:hypothetical protein